MAIGAHGCYFGEDSDIVYALNVCTPKHKPPSWHPDAWHRLEVAGPNAALAYMEPRGKNNMPLYNDFKREHLLGMKKKEVKISQWDLPMQCRHLQSGARECKGGCYVLEKGAKGDGYWKCGRTDCQGHVYCDRIYVYNKEHWYVCFGEKGKRMVCVDPKLGLTLFNDRGVIPKPPQTELGVGVGEQANDSGEDSDNNRYTRY